MSIKKELTKKVKNAAGVKVCLLRRKAVLKKLENVHADIQGIVDLLSQDAAVFSHEALPGFDHTAWAATLRGVVSNIQAASNAIN